MDSTPSSAPVPEPTCAPTPAELLRAAVPAELQQSPHWVAYNAKKIPLRIMKPKEWAKSDDATTWASFDQGLVLLDNKPDGVEGIGYAFTWESGYVYYDLDDCLDENGQLREWAKSFVEPFKGHCYIEVSPSGHGLHIIGRGRLTAGKTLEIWGDDSGKKRTFPEHASEWAKSQPKPHWPEVAVFVKHKYTTITGVIWEGNGTIEQPAEDGSAPWLDEVWKAAGLSLGPSPDTAAAAGADPAAAPEIDACVDSAPFLKDLPGRVVDELKICTPATADDQSDARWAEYIRFHKAGMPPEQILQAIMACDWYERSGAAKKGEKHTLADIRRACEEADEKAAQAAHESEPSTSTEPPTENESSSGISDSSEGKEPWTPPDPKPKYVFQRGSEILDEPDLNPLWLIQGLLPESGVGVIGGEPKSTKTWLGMEIGMALATATPACGEFEVHEQKTVAIFLAEDGKRSVKARLRALAVSRDMEPKAASENLHIICRGRLNILDGDQALSLIETCQQIPNLGLLILDPLRDLHTQEENDSTAMAKVTDALRALRDRLGCSRVRAGRAGPSCNPARRQGRHPQNMIGSILGNG